MCVFAIYYYILSKFDILLITDYLTNMQYNSLLFAFLSVLIYVITDVMILYFMTKKLYEKVSLRVVIKAVMGLYVFNNITPFATGGFPYQLYLYNKNDIPISKTSNIVITRNILYQAVLVMYSIGALLFLPINDRTFIVMLIFINVIIQVVGIIFQILAMYKPLWCKNTVYFFTRTFHKLKLLRHDEKLNSKIDKHIDDFARCNLEIKNNYGYMFRLMILQVISFFFLFSCGYFVFKGFGIIRDHIPLTFIISCIYLFGFIIPTPGGTGGVEGSFVLLFKSNGPKEIIISIMLVWRFLTCYLLILIGSISFLFRDPTKRIVKDKT